MKSVKSKHDLPPHRGGQGILPSSVSQAEAFRLPLRRSRISALVAAALLISTTIRLSAFSRRRELGIMRLVGASNRFIQTPFILEGVVAALAGAILASGAVWAIVHYFVRGYLVEALPTTVFIGYDQAYQAMPILIGTGVALAALASLTPAAAFAANRT